MPCGHAAVVFHALDLAERICEYLLLDMTQPQQAGKGASQKEEDQGENVCSFLGQNQTHRSKYLAFWERQI